MMENMSEQIRLVEALLFASAEPLDNKFIANRLPEGANVDALMSELDKIYKNRGIELKKVGKKWMFKTSPELSFLMQREAKAQKKLSKAGIETLSIIAYHQPVTRAEIEEVRGVSVSPGTIDTLLELNWIKIKGRKKVPGNPITYATTDEFLIHFDLENIKDLPDMEELKSTGLLDNNLPPEIYPENNINNDIINIEDDINNEEGLKD